MDNKTLGEWVLIANQKLCLPNACCNFVVHAHGVAEVEADLAQARRQLIDWNLKRFVHVFTQEGSLKAAYVNGPSVSVYRIERNLADPLEVVWVRI